RSAELAEEIGATNLNVERTWLEIARIYLGERQLVEAQVALERAQRHAAHAGSGSEETEAIRLLAWTHAEQNHLPEAASTFQRGLRLAEQRGDEPSTALMLYGLAMVQAASGREVDALVSIDRALEIATRLGLPHRDEIRARREEIRGRIATGKG
ncbi:MAG TPA: hypothetical protein VFW70_07520, partial [Methylomirabilota bacterium]|nr:hypothetical protein [Methylomirabilota bacterium]